MCGMLESTAKKIKSVKPRGNVMVHVPDHDRAKIDAHSLHSFIMEDYTVNTAMATSSRGQGTF